MANRNLVICSNSVCDVCFQKHSPRTACTSSEIIACKTCFRINVRSSNCTCDHLNYKSAQSLRMVGSTSGPFWYVDIQIFDQPFPAMINTSIFKCRVNHQLSVWIQMTSNDAVDDEASEILVPITCKDGQIAEVQCEIDKTQVEMMELGQQYLKYFGYVLTIGEDTINSQTSTIALHRQEVNYVYNLPEGQALRNHLNKTKRFLKQRRVAKIENWAEEAENRKIVIRTKRRRSTTDSE